MARLIVNVDVDDLEKAVRFYTKALGLRIGRRFGTSGIELVGAEVAIYLLVAAPGTVPFRGGSAMREYSRHWTPVHLDFVVDDLVAAVERAVGAGAKLEGGIQTFAWGLLATLSDPFGHGFCAVQFQGRGYGEVT